MKYLNLTKGFNPYNAKKEDTIKFESFIFSGGEPHIKILDKDLNYPLVNISIKIKSFADVGLLLLAKDAINRLGGAVIEVFLPYFPGARQDRIMDSGEALTSKVYANIFNDNKLKIKLLDPHSDVTPALLDNCKVIDNFDFISEVINDDVDFQEDPEIEYPIVAPDSGASKKIHNLATQLSNKFTDTGFIVFQATKHRDVKTGKLLSFEVRDKFYKEPLLVVDDICDGGGTFIGLAKELKKKGAGHLTLAVTHGIFSKGTEELFKYYDKIYCTDSFIDEYKAKKLNINLIKIKNV